MKKYILPTLSLLAGLLSPLPSQAQLRAPQTPGVRDLMSDTWVATDALGRKTPTAATTRPPQSKKFVGIFYFLTHGSKQFYTDPAHTNEGDNGVDPRVLRDNTQIIKEVGGDPLTKPEAWKDKGTYWWGEPAVGYYLADDPWVARKNLTMLADAGVDVIIFDVTNGPQYTTAYHTILDTAEQMRREGRATPQFMFITFSSCGVVATQLYDNIYRKGLWKDLWFRWNGKPLIFGSPNGHKPIATPPRPDARDFFTWRYSWANTDGPHNNGRDEWQWIDARGPQKFGWHDVPNNPEQVPVALGGWANGNLGRSFQVNPKGGGTEPPLDQFDLAADVADGVFFTSQWRQALKIDPQFIFLTGWNEWTASRQYGPGVTMLGHVTKPGQYYFVDNFNQEFSRDAMPMKGGHADNYYLQMVDGIRQFKGVRPAPLAHGFQAMRLSSFAPWAKITPEFRDAVGDTTHRDWDGWGSKRYTNTTGRNDITTAKIALDAKNVYFYVYTQAKLTPYTGPNWMQLLIDSDQNPKTGWNGYDYVINSKALNANTTTLKRLSDGKTWPVKYKAVGSELAVTVPRALLGLKTGNGTTFDFHWADNVPVGAGDIADWWYNGENAPDGRFNYRYRNTK